MNALDTLRRAARGASSDWFDALRRAALTAAGLPDGDCDRHGPTSGSTRHEPDRSTSTKLHPRSLEELLHATSTASQPAAMYDMVLQRGRAAVARGRDEARRRQPAVAPREWLGINRNTLRTQAGQSHELL
ncbi:MAG: hypothetical protein V9G29_13455 [Burkholderiaceae bacterium]